MNRARFLIIAAVGLMAIQSGCGSKGVGKTGFLSDYSKLRAESDKSLLYMDEAELGRYSSFIVDQVEVHFHRDSKAAKQKTKGKLTDEKIRDLTNYMHTKIVEAITNSGNKLVYQPGPGVARIRAALTDIEKSDPVLNALPQSHLLGAGVGGASMEAEILDSTTGRQIGAIVQSKGGSRIPFSNLGNWTAAKQVIDGWAKRFEKRLKDVR